MFIGGDKTNTLTHCRFEAKAVYGIDHIIVADYDEFIFCPNVPVTSKAQMTKIQKLLKETRPNNIDQVTFIQRILIHKFFSQIRLPLF